MIKFDKSIKVYIGMILLLAVLSAINIFLPVGDFADDYSQQMPIPKPLMALVLFFGMIIVYGGLGLLGYYLSLKIGFPKIWDENISNRQRLVIPSIVGAGIGLFFIIADLIFTRFHSLGPIPHPPFPTSLVVSMIAAIGEEVIFRLFYISFWIWLFSYVIFKNRHQDVIFWIFTGFSALVFAAAHIPSIMFLHGIMNPLELPTALLIELLLLNGVISIAAAYYLRKYGLLAAVMIHLWTDIVWHFLWGLV